MAGDGINDAPALASADVSFGMAAGSDIALEAADITLMRSDLNGVADAVALSRVVMRKIRQNLFFAFVYNVLALPLGGGRHAQPGHRRRGDGAFFRLRGQQLAAAQALEARHPQPLNDHAHRHPQGNQESRIPRRGHPAGVAELVRNGHRVKHRSRRRPAVGFADAAYRAAGARVVDSPAEAMPPTWCSRSRSRKPTNSLAAPRPVAVPATCTWPRCRTSRAPCWTRG